MSVTAKGVDFGLGEWVKVDCVNVKCFVWLTYVKRINEDGPVKRG